ncbi:ThuA domain-containing protein [Aureliella helgolandensis]|nr:ThuA domain-containing protein [Aureliella helgolandensis]
MKIGILPTLIVAGLCVLGSNCLPLNAQEKLPVVLRSQQPVAEGAQQYHSVRSQQVWDLRATAVIVCDMWDAHHCLNAVRREGELAPRVDAFVSALRERGGTIIHAPSGCMDAYEGHAARLRSKAIEPAEDFPDAIAEWCYQIPSEESAEYPIDQSDGGEDDDLAEHAMWAQRLAARGLIPKSPWKKQIDVIKIDETRDFISDSGTEIWSILERREIQNVILVGVHTNMCVLGRPFGLRRLASGGKNVVLARDLTDTMYNPGAWPYVNHFTGTDLIVSHIERLVCPTISSEQVLGGAPFRYSTDQRPRLLMLVAEDEYLTETTLPDFASKHLGVDYRVRIVYGSHEERNEIVGIQEELRQADALLVSVRRRALPTRDLQLVREFVSSGKPVIGIRTASHAFALRDGLPPAGLAVWPEFDAQVWGGDYTGHYGNQLTSELSFINDAFAESVAAELFGKNGAGQGRKPWMSGGSLYKNESLKPGSHVWVEGQLEDGATQPVAWTFIRDSGGKSFYTSLGHVDDFAQPAFQALLLKGIHWACDVQRPVTLEGVALQEQRFNAGARQ